MKIKCQICNKDIIPLGFSSHILSQHNISVVNYYNKFIKKANEGKCVVCGKDTKFYGLLKGYAKCCSVSCHNKSSDFKNKSRNTKLIKYGNEKYVNPEKAKITNIQKYGGLHPKVLNIFKESNKKRQIDNIEEKIKKFNLPIIFKEIKDNNYIFHCNNCNNDFNIQPQLFRLRSIKNLIVCNVCNPYQKPISNIEVELLNFIENNYNKEIIKNSKQIISPYELDIYLPDIKLAFEFNGLYWHCELEKDKNYHLNKTNLCEQQEIHLIHIYEDDWLYKQDIVKSRILNLLGKSKVIYARECEIKEQIEFKEYKIFLIKNHIQGYNIGKYNLGLYYNNELVSLMTFGKLRKNLGQISKEGYFELLRFCNKINTTIVGGANKLFIYFVKKYNPIKIISYADRSWTMNNSKTLYDKLNFKLITKTLPNYFYIIDGCRENRFKYRKDVLVKQGFDKNKSEHDIMLENDFYRIYDSGNLKYEWNI